MQVPNPESIPDLLLCDLMSPVEMASLKAVLACLQKVSNASSSARLQRVPFHPSELL